MKVQITKEMKRVITIAEMPAVNKVLRYAKEDDGMTVNEYAEIAARIASGKNNVKVLEANAEIACNCRISDWYDNGSANFDIWINFTAIIDDGFAGIIIGGAYVTDIHALDNDNTKEIRSRMYIRRFMEVKNT